MTSVQYHQDDLIELNIIEEARLKAEVTQADSIPYHFIRDCAEFAADAAGSQHLANGSTPADQEDAWADHTDATYQVADGPGCWDILFSNVYYKKEYPSVANEGAEAGQLERFAHVDGTMVDASRFSLIMDVRKICEFVFKTASDADASGNAVGDGLVSGLTLDLANERKKDSSGLSIEGFMNMDTTWASLFPNASERELHLTDGDLEVIVEDLGSKGMLRDHEQESSSTDPSPLAEAGTTANALATPLTSAHMMKPQGETGDTTVSLNVTYVLRFTIGGDEGGFAPHDSNDDLVDNPDTHAVGGLAGEKKFNFASTSGAFNLPQSLAIDQAAWQSEVGESSEQVITGIHAQTPSNTILYRVIYTAVVDTAHESA